MSIGVQVNAVEGDLLDHLRGATQQAHRRLEDELDLLRPPLSRELFTTLLQRFYGFHAAWEPGVLGRPELASITAGRRRLPQLAADLEALGMGARDIAALPRCPGAERLGQTAEGALGSLYVMEGSTLGGKLITRALRSADWLPPAGLTYFDPYGEEGGAMWRTFRQELQRLGPVDSAAAGKVAVETFELLHRWLPA